MAIGILSTLVNNFCSQKMFERNKLIWSIFMLEFVAVFGSCLLDLCNNLERIHDGHMLITIVCVFLEVHFTLGFNWLEDIVFGDLC